MDLLRISHGLMKIRKLHEYNLFDTSPALTNYTKGVNMVVYFNAICTSMERSQTGFSPAFYLNRAVPEPSINSAAIGIRAITFLPLYE